MSRAAALLVTLLAASCASSPETEKFRKWPRTAQECALRGGHMQSITMSSQGCVFPAKDAGTVCTDSSQCEGPCDAPEGSPAGWEGAGTCRDMGGPSNHGNIMIDGKATGFMEFD
jgi:hypothetical protein